MVAMKTVLFSVVAVLSVFLPSGVRPQPTIGYSTEDESCSELEEELDFQVEENRRLRSLLESERQTIKTSEKEQRLLEPRESQGVKRLLL